MADETKPPELRSSKRTGPARSVRIGLVSVFAALIALATVLSIPFPPPLYELNWSPPIYMALSILAGPWVGFLSTALGAFIGETYNIATRGGPPIYIPGIIWAKAPEALIIAWARRRSWRIMAVAMVAATLYETVAFFLPDWFFYSYGLFGYGDPTGVSAGFYTALPDWVTMVEVAFIPVSFAIIKGADSTFRRLGFSR